MRGFITLAIAGIISLSSSAFSRDLVVDGKGAINKFDLDISNNQAKIRFYQVENFTGIGDPNLDCNNKNLIVITKEKSNLLSDKLWDLLIYAHVDDLNIEIDIISSKNNQCILTGAKLNQI